MYFSNDTQFVCPCAFGRDDFQIPKALFSSGHLKYLYTERHNYLYSDNSSDITIPDGNYKISIPAACFDVLRRLAIRLGSKKAIYYYWLSVAQIVGASANKEAIRKSYNVISELYSAYTAFKHIESSRLILFQTHPYAPHLRDLYGHILNLNHDHQSILDELVLEQELELQSKDVYDILTFPAQQAGTIICASEYVKKSILETHDGFTNKIHVVPYGVDSRVFYYKKKPQRKVFKFLFVGQCAARKGLYNLLSAWRNGIENSRLEMAGFSVSEDMMQNISKKNILLHGRVSRMQLVHIMQDADCLIFPSISEGYGLVLLQSLSCGTPFIASYNSAAPDLINTIGAGITIDPLSILDIRDKMQDIASNRRLNKEWQSNCQRVATLYNWAHFRHAISSIISEPL